MTFAGEVARRRLVCLGPGGDDYLARRERHPGPARRRGRAGDLQGHRRGDHRAGPGRGAAPEVRRIRAEIPEDARLLSVFTDVFDGFLCHLNGILDTVGVLSEETFWRTVAACVSGYQDRVPHLAGRFRRYDVFAAEFALSCLNRLQLHDNQQMVDLADPSSALQLAGTLQNPIARFAPRP